METTEEKQSAKVPGWMMPWSVHNRETLLILFLCLLVATVLWLINALSKDYVTTVVYPVEYVDLPRNKFITNNPPEQFNLRINTQGFTLVKYKLIKNFNPLLIHVEAIISDFEPSARGPYVISTKNLSEKVSSQLSMDVELLEITPGVLTLAFDSLDIKQVPIASNIEIGFKPRYGLAAPVSFEPSHVTVTGSHDVIRQIDSVHTVPELFKNVSASFRQKIALIIPRQLYIEPDHVILRADIDEFTERTITIPVWVNNQPDSSKVRLFPKEVEISFIIGLSSYTLIKPEDFSLYVSWEDIVLNKAQLQVKVKKQPSVVNNIKIIPENVEYLIEKN
jgi:YbbR domain-containing protein